MSKKKPSQQRVAKDSKSALVRHHERIQQDHLYRELYKKLAKEIKQHYATAAARWIVFKEQLPGKIREMEKDFHRMRKKVLSKKEREKIARKFGIKL